MFLPSDLDGSTPPPVGAPNYFYRQADGAVFGGADRVEIWEFHVDWIVPGNTTFTGPTNLNLAAFDSDLCGFNSFACIPQPGSAARCPTCVGPPNGKTCSAGTQNGQACELLDPINEPPMWRFPYRNFGGHETLVGNFAVDVDGSNNSGIRWFELRKSGGGGWTVHQQGTYAPQFPGLPAFEHRWIGSIAMDQFGNIALGYNVSSAQGAFPSIRYTGRSAGDPLGLLPQGEETIQPGAGLIANNRWGDYSAMTVDPADDCTFWYTADYVTAGGGRQSRIANFRFDDCGTDLAIDKTVTPDPGTAGKQLIYTVTVNNNGPLDATDVIVVDDLDDNVAFVTNTAVSCASTAPPAGEFTCNLGDIPSGGSESFQIKVLVDSDLTEVGGPTTVSNTASASADQNELNNSDNTVTIDTIIEEEADLRVIKDCKPDSPAMAGSTANCKIHVDNLGPSSARDVILTDVHFSSGAFTLSNFGTCVQSPAGTLTCNLGDIDAGARVTVFVDFTSNEAVDVNDTATVASKTPDPDTLNNIAEDSVRFTAKADLVITKSAPITVIAGNNLTYDLTVDNLGPSTASNVVVRDVLPAGVSIISVSAPGGTCNPGVPGNAALPTTCTFNTVAVADPLKTMQIVVKVLPQTTGILHNNARVSSDTADPNNANDLATIFTEVNASADVSVVKTIVSPSPGPVTAGNLLTYQILVVNGGPSTAQDVEIDDTLPATVNFVSATVQTPPGVCALQSTNPDHVNCQIGDMDPGEQWIVSLTVKVKSDTPDGAMIDNIATVGSPITPDPVPGNNNSLASILVNTRAELWIDKTGVQITGNPSRTVRFTLTINNKPGCEADDPVSCGAGGPSDAQGVEVTDTLPLDPKKIKVVFVSQNCTYMPTPAPHKVVCNVAGGTIPFGQFATFTIDIQVAGSIGDITNTAMVATSTTDPNLVNNTDVLKLKFKGGSNKPGQ